MQLVMRAAFSVFWTVAMAAGVTVLPTDARSVFAPIVGSAHGQPSAPELSPNLGWLNTDRPVRFADELRGHVVLLDFWTYCCINCVHVLPDLEYLQDKYADKPFVVISVHSAKFTNDREREAIRQAVFRYDIKPPVVIDSDMGIWSNYGIRGWPGFALIGSDGALIGIAGGEGQRELLDNAIGAALDDGRDRDDLAASRVEYEPDAMVAPATGLRFPGNVLADRGMGMVFIADSSADRVVVTTYPDDAGRTGLVEVIGAGERRFVDGPPEVAGLHGPQGMALDPDTRTLYVADTKNHAVRAVDLDSWSVSTIAGTGERSFDTVGGGIGTEQGIASPWDLELSHDKRTLYIAMAGTHQIWQMDLVSGVVGRLAGSGRENAFDGRLEEAALAQPSGLALSADGRRLYFADAESSSVRVVDLDAGEVRTAIGHTVDSMLENGLFEFGDIDGAFPHARLQHVLGVTMLPADGAAASSGDTLLIADTYNHKLKTLDAESKTIRTVAGGRGAEAGGPALDEPGGLHVDPATGLAFIADTNNHRIVLFNPDTGEHAELTIATLALLADGIGSAIQTPIALRTAGEVTVSINADLPDGATVNREFPKTVRVIRLKDNTIIAQQTTRGTPLPIEINLEAGTLSDRDEILVELSFGWCSNGDSSVCRPADLAWIATIMPSDAATASLSATVE